MLGVTGDDSLDVDEVRHRTLKDMFTNTGYSFRDFFFPRGRLPLSPFMEDDPFTVRALHLLANVDNLDYSQVTFGVARTLGGIRQRRLLAHCNPFGKERLAAPTKLNKVMVMVLLWQSSTNDSPRTGFALALLTIRSGLLRSALTQRH